MSIDDLVERLKSTPLGAELDVMKIREEIHENYKHATTARERNFLLDILNAVMDVFERNISSPDDLETFRKTRQQDYRLLLITEAVIGEHISPELIDAVTRREVAAGRMAPDDDFRQLAAAGGMLLASPSHAEPAAIDAKKDARPRRRGLAWLRRGKT